jgi:hypothetical protein
MTDLVPWPFPLPERWTEQLGYERAAGPLVMPESVRALLRRTNVTEEQIAATEQAMATRRPRRWVALWWEPAGDELAFGDGIASGAGQLNHWPYLDYLHPRGAGLGPIPAWLVEHEIDLGSSEAPATHALVLDRDTGHARVAPVAVARAVVRDQRVPEAA